MRRRAHQTARGNNHFKGMVSHAVWVINATKKLLTKVAASFAAQDCKMAKKRRSRDSADQSADSIALLVCADYFGQQSFRVRRSPFVKRYNRAVIDRAEHCQDTVICADDGDDVIAADNMDIDTFLDGGFETVFAQDTSRPALNSCAHDARQKKQKLRTNNSRTTRSCRKQTQSIAHAQASPRSIKAAGPAKQEMKSHKAQLEALKESDPAFYQYLAESDKALLDFSDSDADESGSDRSGSRDDSAQVHDIADFTSLTERGDDSITPRGLFCNTHPH